MQELAPAAALRYSFCALHGPVRGCLVCGASNRGAARFCRRCRAPQPPVPLPEKLQPVSILSVAGTFRRPPLVSDGMAYAIDSSGSLVAAPLHAGAGSTAIAHLPPAAAFNRAALVDVAAVGSLRPGACLLAVHPAGVDLAVLATGEVLPLYRPAGSNELAVNSQGSAAGLRAVVSDGDMYAFAERAPGDSVALTVRRFGMEAAPEYPLVLAGQEALGPVRCGSLVALCTERELGVFDLHGGTPYRVRLPRGFEPMLARRAGAVNVPPGAIPLTASPVAGGVTAWVAGAENGRNGLLRIELPAGEMRFEPTSRDAALSSNPDGSLCLAEGDRVRLAGSDAAAQPTGPLQPGFPAVLSGGSLVFFGEQRRPGQHVLNLRAVESVSAPAEARFEDLSCTELSCCAPVVSAAGVAVPYLVPDGAAGLRIALWSAA